MKCPECERVGLKSKLYTPNVYSNTAMGGSETYYDEDGCRHHHEVNDSIGRGGCSNGHLLDFKPSTRCPAPECPFGTPETITLVGEK